MRPATGSGPPRYQEIMRAISNDISSGRVAVGTRLPTEQQLCSVHGVGRHTIREAIRGLVDLGMLERRPRVGTTVIAAEPVVGYHWVPESVEDIAHNMNATWIVRPRGDSMVADVEAARRLGCQVGTRWYRFAGPRILRHRSARDPVCFSEQYVPNTAKARRAIVTAAISPLSSPLQRVEQEIRAGLLNDEQADALRAEPGSPALVVVRRHYGARDRLVAIGIHTHPADRYSIVMQLHNEADPVRRDER